MSETTTSETMEPKETSNEAFTFERPELYENRELSWLGFNRRVLEEAQDPETALLERVKFLCIVSSNLDEFFEIRVSGIKQQIENNVSDPGPDDLSAPEVFDEIQRRVRRIVLDQYDLWNTQLVPALSENNVNFYQVDELNGEEKEWAQNYFFNEVYPVLTPLAIDPSHPFPQLLNKSLNIIVTLERDDTPGEIRYAIVQVPRVLSRLIELPNRPPKQHGFIFLSDLISTFIDSLFPGVKVGGAYAFRVTRNSDLYFDEEEAQNLLRTIEEELRKRNKGNAVRLEMESDSPVEVQNYLLDKFDLKKDDLYLANGPLNLIRLFPLCDLDVDSSLKVKPWTPVPHPLFESDADHFEVLRHQDVFLHHPYDNFSCVVDILSRAARDPRVLALKMTLYRTSGDSPIIKALINAAQEGKQVTVVVELKARFDEANNIQWARRMEEAGIHVVYGLVGLKTHSKVMLIVRRDEDRIRHYCHLGTGNYHPKTARLYTDTAIMTTRPEITNEVVALFNTMTGMSDFPNFRKLMVAPFGLSDKFIDLIDQEIANQKAGKPAYIFAKMNSLVDEEIIQKLYEASTVGVRVDLLIRGICCLRPGIPGVSENIVVRSIIDSFLEHSRIFYFENGGDSRLYMGSADWMPRNLYRRVEVIFPVDDVRIKDHVTKEIIQTYLADNTHTRLIQPDGSHSRIKPGEGDTAMRCQVTFMELAEKRLESSQNPTPGRLIPIRNAPEA